MTPAEFAALRVTVLETTAFLADAEYEAARKDTVAAVKAMIAETKVRSSKGALQVPVELPSGEVIGHLSIKAGTKSTETAETGLHEWVAERNPEALEEYALSEAGADERVLDLLLEKCPDLFGLHLKPGALEDPRALALLAAEFPGLVSSRVRSSALRAYVKEAVKVTDQAPKGWLFDPETGERLQLVTETEEPPSGAFAFIGEETAARRAAVMAALAAGDPVVRAIAFGAVGELGPGAETTETGERGE